MSATMEIKVKCGCGSILSFREAIAAEMGEAVQGSDHYQVLFILGVVLFLITCGINIASDLIVKGVRKQGNA